MKQKILLLVALALLGATGMFAQSNEILDKILEQRRVGFSYAAYLVLSAAGIVADTVTPEQAMEALRKQDWGIRVPDEPTDISLGQYAFLLVRAFDIPGGIMFRLLPGPRYAAREIAFLGFVTENPSPYRGLPGAEAVQILNNVLAWKEGLR